MIRATHTYAALEVSAEAYDEIAGKLREAGYDHAFVVDEQAIDMQGIGLVRGPASPKVEQLRADWVKAERRAIMFGDAVAMLTIAMQAAVIDFELCGPDDGIQWIRNTLFGPGHYPDIDAARAMGGAQAWFDTKMAEQEAWRAAHPGPEAPAPAADAPIETSEADARPLPGGA
jgi:hypothetical protein